MKARDAANEALRCIREGSLDGLAKIFSTVNRKKFAVLDDKARERLSKYIEKSMRAIGNVMVVDELREGPAFLGPGSIVARIRAQGNEIFVVSLKKEGDDYVFDDIDSPSIAEYGALRRIED